MNDNSLPAPNSFSKSASRPFRTDLVEMPQSWDDAVAQVAALHAEWEALDLDDEAESARVSDLNDQVMLAFLRTPAPDTDSLIYKLMILRSDGRLVCGTACKRDPVSGVIGV